MKKAFWGFVTGIVLCIAIAALFTSIPRSPQLSARTVESTPIPTSNVQDPQYQSTIDIYAAGQPALGQYPIMVLTINGTIAKTFPDVEGNYAKRKFQKFSYIGFAKIQPSDVQIQFVNDYYDPKAGEDRNLYVDKIVIDGKVYETEADTTLSSGSWSPTGGCSEGYKETEELNCNGYFQYDSPQRR